MAAGLFLQPFRKSKRIRTAFSPSQLLQLERAFEGNHYVVGTERKQLANRLALSETQVGSEFSLICRPCAAPLFLSGWRVDGARYVNTYFAYIWPPYHTQNRPRCPSAVTLYTSACFAFYLTSFFEKFREFSIENGPLFLDLHLSFYVFLLRKLASKRTEKNED